MPGDNAIEAFSLTINRRFLLPLEIIPLRHRRRGSLSFCLSFCVSFCVRW